jgi:hypothetical protein
MKTSDIVMWTLCAIIFLGLIVLGIVTGAQKESDAKTLCHPYRVKHAFYDEDTHKIRAVCASADGTDILR